MIKSWNCHCPPILRWHSQSWLYLQLQHGGFVPSQTVTTFGVIRGLIQFAPQEMLTIALHSCCHQWQRQCCQRWPPPPLPLLLLPLPALLKSSPPRKQWQLAAEVIDGNGSGRKELISKCDEQICKWLVLTSSFCTQQRWQTTAAATAGYMTTRADNGHCVNGRHGRRRYRGCLSSNIIAVICGWKQVKMSGQIPFLCSVLLPPENELTNMSHVSFMSSLVGCARRDKQVCMLHTPISNSKYKLLNKWQIDEWDISEMLWITTKHIFGGLHPQTMSQVTLHIFYQPYNSLTGSYKKISISMDPVAN